MKSIGCSVARLCATARAIFKIVLNEKFRRNRHFIDENRAGNLLIRIRALARAQIHIHGALRAEQYIARMHAGDILYIPEGASPRRIYLRIARRARRARVLYESSDHEARWIWSISISGH